MINKEQLNSIGYHQSPGDKNLYVVFGSWEYGFDIGKQELWHLNDGVGEPILMCRITNFEKLKELLELYGELY
jgi:hypothetical protein